MSKTPFSKKVEILGNFYLMYSNDKSIDENWQDFIRYEDIALPLAFFALIKVASVSRPEGVKHIEDTWIRYCTNLGIDPDGRYADLTDTFETANRNNAKG